MRYERAARVGKFWNDLAEEVRRFCLEADSQLEDVFLQRRRGPAAPLR